MNASDSYVAASHDHGATWGPLRKTNNDTCYWFQTGGAVAPNGDVYFVTTVTRTATPTSSCARPMAGRSGRPSASTSRELPGCAWAGDRFGFLGSSAALSPSTAWAPSWSPTAPTTRPGRSRAHSTRARRATARRGARERWSPRRGINGNFPRSRALHGGPLPPRPGRPQWLHQCVEHLVSPDAERWRQLEHGGRDSPISRPAHRTYAAGYRFPYGDYFEVAVDRNGLTIYLGRRGSATPGRAAPYTRGN